MPLSRLFRAALFLGALAVLLAPVGNAEPSPLSCAGAAEEPYVLVVTVDTPVNQGSYVLWDEPACTITIVDP